jgi:hypothetical protein
VLPQSRPATGKYASRIGRRRSTRPAWTRDVGDDLREPAKDLKWQLEQAGWDIAVELDCGGLAS